jgi:glycosyltransferase involved in cell wall biosynthesis
MLIDQVVASLNPAAGGPSRTVLQLTEALANNAGAEVRLITQAVYSDPVCQPRSPKVRVCIGHSKSITKLRLGLPGREALALALAEKRPDLVHSNGLWHPLNHWSSSAARNHHIPLVIQPRGMLEPWALAWKSGKKRLALRLYQQRDLESAAILVATAEQEAEHFRQFGLRQPIAVIPNGVDLEVALANQRGGSARPDGLRRALFLSRIHPKKGLLNLLEVWSLVDPRDWILQIAGPDEGGHLAEVLTAAERLGITDRVQYIGELDDDAKWGVYRDANLFILPTFSENFGVVVAEALAQGLPVITTTGTPWQELQARNCGWWVEPTVDGLVGALRDAVAKEPAQLRQMGVRGTEFAHEFDWKKIALQTADVYRWILGQGDRPDCVYLS